MQKVERREAAFNNSGRIVITDVVGLWQHRAVFRHAFKLGIGAGCGCTGHAENGGSHLECGDLLANGRDFSCELDP